MSDESFDPYITWLEITSSARPPNYYQLLDLAEFEADSQLIADAVDRQATKLQMVTGDDVDVAKQLLREVGQARLCLTSKTRKIAYDSQLRNDNATFVPPPQGSDENVLEGNSSAIQIESSLVTSHEDASSIQIQTDNRNSVGDANLELGQFSIDTGSTPSGSSEKSSALNVRTVDSSNDLEAVPELGGDLRSERIESQRAKELQDDQIKRVFDKVLWISCGICVLAIAGVLVSRNSGCNREPIVVQDAGNDESATKKMASGKQLRGGFKSPLVSDNETTDPIGNQLSGSDSVENHSVSGKETTSVQDSENFKAATESAIGFFGFEDEVKADKITSGDATLLLTNVNWRSHQETQLTDAIELTDTSRVFFESNQIDGLSELSIVGRFKSNDVNKTTDLVCIKNLILVRFNKGAILVSLDGKFDDETPTSMILEANKWFQFVLTISATELRLIVNGEPVIVRKIDFQGLPKTVDGKFEIGGNGVSNRLTGQIDYIGVFGHLLDDKTVNSFGK